MSDTGDATQTPRDGKAHVCDRCGFTFYRLPWATGAFAHLCPPQPAPRRAK